MTDAHIKKQVFCSGEAVTMVLAKTMVDWNSADTELDGTCAMVALKRCPADANVLAEASQA